ADRHPRSAKVAHALGSIAEKRERWPEAAEHLQQALDRGSSSAQVHTQLAQVQRRLENLEAVEQHLAQALAERGDFAPARILQARIRRDAGRVDEAVELLDGVIERDPENVSA
ncbi:tetratricopeptide repeat protein, partial [Halorhodospira sp. 9622]|uniref:tetratricopeptide repeat protein n=1 Tax=Halorhodospira sp. 9622 TaxID=2899136 RepID=UPI001EE7A186